MMDWDLAWVAWAVLEAQGALEALEWAEFSPSPLHLVP